MQTWKKQAQWTPRSSIFFFFAKFLNISAKFGFLNMRIRNKFKNVIFIGCKLCKIFKYSVDGMVIVYSYCQKTEKECIWVKYLIYAIMLRFKICRNSCVFPPNLKAKNSELTKKWFFPSLMKFCPSALNIFLLKRNTISYLLRNVWYFVRNMSLPSRFTSHSPPAP